MPRLAANISTMFGDMPVPARFDLARRCRFEAVEFLAPYGHAIDDIRHWLHDTGLTLLLINISPGEAGETGTAALPGRETAFREAFDQALDYAMSLDVAMIHVLAGRAAGDIRPSRALFIEQIRRAADLAAARGITLNLEPLNTRDVPGYLYTRREETAALIAEIGRDNVRFQFDFYHQQIMDGDLAAGLTSLLPIISHVQLSSLPGRHEPQHGEVNVHYLLRHLDASGYRGWVGCEYWPRDDLLTGLEWAAPYGIHQPD